MANTDYIKKGGGPFASSIALDAPISEFTTMIPFTRARLVRTDAIQPGMAAMVGEEIMRVENVFPLLIEVKRGCADTVPAAHDAESVVWIFNAASTGTDKVERSATEVAALKVSPYTLGGGGVPLGSIIPVNVEFNWRYFRPYPPGRLMVNGARWTNTAVIDDTTPAANLTWTHRDRVLQADQLIGHDDDSIGPEPGTTYTLRITHPITDQVVRTEVGIRGDSFMYRRAQALYDLGMPSEILVPTYAFCSSRDGFDSWQQYGGSFEVHPASAPLEVQVMPFEQRVIESPYALNVKNDLAQYDGNYTLAMAARPSDRMADRYELFTPTNSYAPTPFTPWIVSDFRLPELETIINVRTSSLYDGVTLAGVQVGHMGLIDDEIVQVVRVDVAQVEVKRGCLDTVPAVHIASSRVWFFEVSASLDGAGQLDGDTVGYRLRPVSYGAPLNIADMPMNSVTFQRRAELPYAPGRVVVNGRPWFEEVQAIAGSGVTITWARRNRIAQGAGVVAHADADQVAETGQTTRLKFFVELPSHTAGEPAVEATLREVDVAGTSYVYDYGQAVTDGNIAGGALGECGTVLIKCRVYALRDGLASLQSYVVPIRVPSFPC